MNISIARTLKLPSLCHGHSVKGPGLVAMAAAALCAVVTPATQCEGGTESKANALLPLWLTSALSLGFL